MNEDGSMAKGQDLFDFADKHKLKIGKIEDLISYRLKREKLVKLKKSSEIKVKNQKYKIIYGGSVNSKNVLELKKINDLKGFLIGSASLRAKNFIDIIKKSTN